MSNLSKFLNLDLLKSLPTLTPPMATAPGENPPHTLLENPSSYSIVMNLLGIDEKDIGIRVNESNREIAVLAKKEAYNAKRGFFWIFGVPREGALDSISTRYKAGVLEIVIPKNPRFPFSSAA